MWSGKRYSNHALTVLVIVVLFFGIPFSCAGGQIHDKEIFEVKHVIDGDTIELANGEKVRLIGVDTPETKHPNKPVEYFGEEAYRFTKRMVKGKKVRLEFD